MRCSRSKILLGLRNNEPLAGCWFTPGGSLLKNERMHRVWERIVQAELGLDLSATQCRLMGIWDHFYDTSVISEKISTHHVNLPHVLSEYDDRGLVVDDQHRAIGWFG